MGQIKRDLPNDAYQAATNAVNPSSTNPFFTQEDAEAGFNIDANLSPVIDNTFTSEPFGLPSLDDSYIVASPASGLWAGQDNNIATWDGEQWIFYMPMVNDTTTVLTGTNAGNIYSFDGSVWTPVTSIITNASPFKIAGSTFDAGGNIINTIARTGAIVLGQNQGVLNNSAFQAVGAAIADNFYTRQGLAANFTGANLWSRLCTITLNSGNQKTYQILFNEVSRDGGHYISAVIHLSFTKPTPTPSIGVARVRVVNISQENTTLPTTNSNYKLDDNNFVVRRYSNNTVAGCSFRIYYRPTIANTSVSVTVLNGKDGGKGIGATGIVWQDARMATIEGTAFGGSLSNYATYNYSGQRTNISAVVDPTVNDDVTFEYSKGSLWYNNTTSNPKVWICLNNTAGAAVWKLLTLTDNNNNLVLPGGLQFGGGFSVGNITANTNNLNVTGLESSILVRLSSTGNYDLTGIVVPDVTKCFFFNIFNINPQAPTPGSFSITFKNQNAGSAAQNRFLLGGDVNLQPGEGVTLLYDPVDQRWRSPGKNI